MRSVAGLVLAAGAGTRMGRPKALIPGWLDGAVGALHAGGCAQVTVVLGAEAERARPLVPADAEVVVAPDWEDGMSASLRCGLDTVAGTAADAVVVHLVDLPDVGPDVVARLLAHAAPDALVRAAYAGTPGHPVLLGRDHWDGVRVTLTGDAGARAYLRDRDVTPVECGDLATGADLDHPSDPSGR